MKGMQIGIVLLVIGIGLLLWGYNISESIEGKLSTTFSGSPGDKAMILYIVGGICAALGLFKIIKK